MLCCSGETAALNHGRKRGEFRIVGSAHYDQITNESIHIIDDSLNILSSVWSFTMTSLLVPLVLAQAFSTAAVPTPAAATGLMAVARANEAIVDRAFGDWQAGHGSFYELLIDNASVTISGRSPHSGTFSKAQFLEERAKPFQARFLEPIVPTRWKIWAVDDQVIVRWDSQAISCDGRPYLNSYAYFVTMKAGHAEALTMFLDMGAFDEVWSRCSPADVGKESKR